MKYNLKGFFDIVGEVIHRKLIGVFDIVGNYNSRIKCHIGDKTYKYKDINSIESFLFPSPNLYNGQIYDIENGVKIPIPNANIYFIRGLAESNFITNKVIVEQCKTDEFGTYKAHISDGIYSMKVECGKHSEIFHNVNIKNGLNKTFYYTCDDLITKRIGNTLTMSNNVNKLICGHIVDLNDRPVSGVEIIISYNNMLYVYCITDESGWFNFMLPTGTYDIRIRGDKYSLKMANNVTFNEDEDLIEVLMYNNLFKRGEWICK